MNISPSLIEEVCNLAIAIQQIPAPSLEEARRAEFVQAQFIAEGLDEVSKDPLGNVYACLPGNGQAPPLVVSAHLDTVFPRDTDLSVVRDGDTIAGPGIGDNSMGVAGLFGLARSLRQRPHLPGDVWLVANVGEEGLGDLKGMRAVVDRFGAAVQAYIIVEGMALGQVYHAGLSVRRYRVHAAVEGGHSWVDYGRPSAIHELAGVVRLLYDMQLPTSPRTTLNVGVISGGTSVNTIAAQACMELDLRSERGDTLAWLVGQVELAIRSLRRPGVDLQMEVIGDRPGGEIPVHHPLVQIAMDCLEEQSVQPHLNRGSTDANIPFSRGIPAVCVGLTIGAGAHTLGEYIYTKPLEKGLAQLVALVERVFQWNRPARQSSVSSLPV